MKKRTLKKYADLIVKVGANVQKGQEVIINADLEIAHFVEYVVESAYKAGAKEVIIKWSDDNLRKLHYKYQKTETLGTFKDWEIERLKYRTNVQPVMIRLESSDPDGLKGIDQAKMSEVRKMLYPVYKPFADESENKYQWTIAAVPGEKWAKKLFPQLSKKQAVKKLWDAILFASRADGFNPIRAWEDHNANLADHARTLNMLELQKLYIRSKNGTDLQIGLIPDALFMAGGDTTLKGIYFNPNIPTEECFTTPKKGEAEGIVYATKPLSYQGEVIDGFYLKFKDGKVVEAYAKKNNELLQNMLNSDENARYLGEVALVPKESPINKLGFLFFNTLFDENATCHLALGAGFTNCIIGYDQYSKEELTAKGVNDSMIHVDFMFGTDDLEIDGLTKNGQRVAIFRKGTWVS
ncbi:MAG: aminopeptidase [Erysipelotrichaceae bacterium]|jgi:aminopeptidase|nr:aminopeptidase [Bacillota bacterium]MDY0118683.1 aminopeptidase [Bacilli bacterium]NLJ32787.1 aminopeptidase [Erysipelotrichaceae bacterium]HPK86336.1 aminopeptidase [Bacilli bacterium]